MFEEFYFKEYALTTVLLSLYLRVFHYVSIIVKILFKSLFTLYFST